MFGPHHFFILWMFAVGVNSYRLPTTVIPEHYKLTILTHLGEPDNFNFEGKVWIQTTCLEPTQKIILHSKNLTLSNNLITVQDTSASDPISLNIAKIEEEKENDFIVIHLEKSLAQDHKYEIFIAFKGKLIDSLAGFYRSSYMKNGSKEKRWLGVTQFEPTSARKAFPCFDEPGMKATFDIILGRKDEYSTISNMPLLTTKPIEEMLGYSWDTFEQSVPMSTYLVAFIVSDFGYQVSDASKQNNVTFKIWARTEALHQVNFAKEVGPKSLEYYEDFFDIKYPLPKQDMVAIPDFNAGAMENWGLITYREAYLLFDPRISSTTSQHRVASVIAHELAHQWFGNLVTMKWWTDLWLNEGFATYMASLAVHHLFPEWNSLEEEAVSNLLNVFSFDSLKNSHPVSVPIGHPNEIDEYFDTISYKKGSLLIRMMGMFLGHETLRKGVSHYLKQHKYGNAEQDDLWSSLTEEAHKNGILPSNLTVKTVMDTWTLQTGYPVIKVTRDYQKGSAEITQERFIKDAIKAKESDPCWWVPLSYTNGKDLEFNSSMPKSWLQCPNAIHVVDNLADEKTWVIFNVQAGGIYKINYDEENWKLLTEALLEKSFKTIPTLNRVQLIDDSSDLAWTGDIKYDVLLNLLKYLKNEEEYLPWKAALTNINALNKQIKQASFYGHFKAYIRKLLTPIYHKVGGLILSKAKSGKLDSIKHQVLIVNWACKFEAADCVSRAGELFAEYQNSSKETENPISKDLRSVIYCTTIRHGGEKEWDFIWAEYKKSNVATEKDSILSNLGCTRELWLLSRYLEWSINEDSGIRKQDSSSVFTAVANNDVGYYIATNFLYSNIEKLYKYLSSNPRRLSRYLSSIADKITNDQQYVEFESFIKENQKYFKEIRQGVEQSLETARLNVQWQKRHLSEIEKLFVM